MGIYSEYFHDDKLWENAGGINFDAASEAASYAAKCAAERARERASLIASLVAAARDGDSAARQRLNTDLALGNVWSRWLPPGAPEPVNPYNPPERRADAEEWLRLLRDQEAAESAAREAAKEARRQARLAAQRAAEEAGFAAASKSRFAALAAALKGAR